MTIDPNCIGAVLGQEEVSWTAKDAMLYALGVGAGTDELAFTTDNSHGIVQRVLPTFGVIIGTYHGVELREVVGDFDASKGVMGGQAIRLRRRIPVEGRGLVTARVGRIVDKGVGKNAIIEVESEVADLATGEVIATALAVVVIRGAGGFGGDRGSAARSVLMPDRSPDHEIIFGTREDQALVYRLSGDDNPLHSDPWFAREMAGYPTPILHGLCTYGFAGRALIHALCSGDDGLFCAMEGRFSAPVFPGEFLNTRIWETPDGALFQTVASPDGRVVIDGGRFERTKQA